MRSVAVITPFVVIVGAAVAVLAVVILLVIVGTVGRQRHNRRTGTTWPPPRGLRGRHRRADRPRWVRVVLGRARRQGRAR
jgi:hypothetical protein